jgi:hypothetical protein
MSWLLTLPAVQGLAVALIVEAIKRSPLGPSSGAPVRALAVALATIASVTVSAMDGRLDAVTLDAAARELLSAGGTILAALGAYASSKPSRP